MAGAVAIALRLAFALQEFFLTVREVLNILCSPTGQVLSGQVEGHIEAVCHLNGMPDCKMGVNDRVSAAPAPQRTSAREQPELEGASFHQCVKLHKYSEDREIQFVPPDGEFELMQYRISSGVQVPFRVQSTLKQHGRARTELTVQLRSLYPAKCIAMKVKLFVPLPPNFQKYDNATMTGGWMKPGTQEGCLVWKMRDLEGQKELQLNLTLHNLSSTSDQAWDKPPIKVYFELPGWTASGLKVTFLRILERSHANVSKCRKYVRYHSHSGQFDVRMA